MTKIIDPSEFSAGSAWGALGIAAVEGDEHYASPVGEARVLVVERAGVASECTW